jgi:hypothetical protein
MPADTRGILIYLMPGARRWSSPIQKNQVRRLTDAPDFLFRSGVANTPIQAAINTGRSPGPSAG